MHFRLLCIALACARGVDVTPLVDVFSAHPGLVFQTIDLTNPSAEDVDVELKLSRSKPSARRLASSPSLQRREDLHNCARPGRLLARFHKVEGERHGIFRRRLQEDLRSSYTSWWHLSNLDMEILEFCGTPEEELSRVREKYGSRLEFVEIDHPVFPSSVPNDADLDKLWGLKQVGSLDAWARLSQLALDSEETVVAVIDTGIQLDHPDIQDSLWRNPGEIPGNGIDDDGNGFIDDVHGYDFAGETGNSNDDHGHGTHCAGIIAATANNGVGTAGVGSRLGKVRVMSLRFINETGTGGTVSGAVRALEYALSFGVPVSSSSWGGPDTSEALRAAIQKATEAGHLFVAAAGNGGTSIADGTYYPCVYRQAGVLCVAATDRSDEIAEFSNYATKYVEIAAPGFEIYSAWIGSGYATHFGTSMSTPYVAGAAALVVSEFGYAGSRVRQMLLDSSVLHEKLQGKVDGGRLDVMNLISTAESASNFWFEADGDRTATVRVNVPGNSATAVRLQLGSAGLAAGIYQAVVNVSWPGGETKIPVTYTIQGQPELQLLQSFVDWPQAPANASVDVLVNFTNTGNGSARVRVQRLEYPFVGQEEESIIPPKGSGGVTIRCSPKTTGEWLGRALFNTNSGLDAWDSSQPQSLEFGTVFEVSLKCVSKKDPYLKLATFSGAAEVLRPSNDELRFFERVVHAEWEPFLKGEEVEGDLVLPGSNNSRGCSPYETDVAGSIPLISRGECFFSDKARFAKEAKAIGVLLFDNQAETTLPILAMPRESSIPEVPMFMVSKAEGQSLRERLEVESVRIKMRWQTVRAYTLPGRSRRVTMTISNEGGASLRWTAKSSLSFGSHSFYENFSPRSEGSQPLPQFSWTSGEELSFFSSQHADDESLLQTLPFNFSFYGQMFEEVWISSNGFVAFDSNGNSSSLSLPFKAQTTKPNGIVAGFGWDLACGTCKISSSLIANEGNPCFVVQYANMSFFDQSAPHGAGSEQISFEIRLCEDGQVVFLYHQFPEPHSEYLNAFIGLETADGLASINIRADLPFSAQRPFVVILQPWLRAASPTSGFLQANETVQLVYDVRSNIGHSGLVHIAAEDDSGLWRSQQDVRLVQERLHFTAAAGDWGPCLVEDCKDLYSGRRKRTLQCLGVDGQSYDWDTFCTDPLASCSDLRSEWRDKDGSRCQEYEEKQWCLVNGSWGSGWRSAWGAFTDYSFAGSDASTVCCACGGGVSSPPLVAAAACEQNLAAMDMDCDGTIDCSDPCPLDRECLTAASSTSAASGANIPSNLTTTTSSRSTSIAPSSSHSSLTLSESNFKAEGCLVMMDTLDLPSESSSVTDSANQGVSWGRVLLAIFIGCCGEVIPK